MTSKTSAICFAWSAAIGLFLCGAAAPAATITVGGTGGADCTFWCVDRLQQVYNASSFSGLSTISQVTFFAAPANGSSWDGIGAWQMSLSTSANPVGALDTTFANNVGVDNAVFATINPAAGSPAAGTPISFSGSFVYDPSQGDLLVDIVRVAGTAAGVGLDSGVDAGLIDRAYAFFGTVTADTANQGGYAVRTQFEVNAVPEPSTLCLLALGGLAALAIVRGKRMAA